MPAIANLKPRKIKNEPWRKHQWFVWVPASLSETGKQRKVYFRTKDEAEGHAEVLKARKENFGVSLGFLTPSKIAEAGEAFKQLSLVGDPFSLNEAVRFAIEHTHGLKAGRSSSSHKNTEKTESRG